MTIGLFRLISLAGLFSVLMVPLVWAQESMENTETKQVSVSLPQSVESEEVAAVSDIPHLNDLDRPATNLHEWLTEIAQSIAQITAVQVNATETGVEIVLRTEQGTLTVPAPTRVGNTLIADIPNAVLALPDNDAFSQANPIEGIALVRVTGLPANRVRVAITGRDAPPVAEVRTEAQGLVLAVTVGKAETTAEEDEIELVVTAELENRYRVPDTSVGTRTDTPLRDIPQSIQIVPQQVLEDQNITNLNEALRNLPSVSPNRGSTSEISQFSIRGFRTTGDNNVLRNGLRESRGALAQLSPNVERIEVLLGPASVLYGSGGLGGTVNTVTKQPLRDPFYAVDATIGSYDFYRGAIDLSGPLNDSKTLSYRLNTGYQNRGSFVDFFEEEQFTVAPVFRWDISERTRITLEGEYIDFKQVYDAGLPAVGTVLPNPNGEIPRGTFAGDPDGIQYTRQYRLGYRLEHEFSDNWSIQQAFQWRQRRITSNDRPRFNFAFDADNRTLNGILFDVGLYRTDTYDLNVNVVGRFSTGSIDHQKIG